MIKEGVDQETRDIIPAVDDISAGLNCQKDDFTDYIMHFWAICAA